MATIDLPNGFAPRALGQKSAMRYFDNGGLRGVYCWPRRYGKDLTFVHQTCKAMHERRGMYLHMLPNHKQARKVIWDGFDNDGRRIIDSVFPPEIRESKNETEMKIVLKCGSLWQLVGSDYYDSIVGANPVGLVMSEAALSDPRAWNYFRPMLAGNGGWSAFISTPRGRNWFHKLMEYAKSDPMWDWSHLTAYDTQHIPAHVLEDERRQMPDELFRQEYLCDFSAANIGAIFGKYMEVAEREGRIVEALPPDPMASLIISSDIGYRDKASFWWWRVMRGGFELVDYDEGTGLDAEEWIERLRDEHPRADRIYLPHDAKVKTFQSRHSVIEQFLKGNIAGEVIVNPQRKKQDSINAGRKVLKSVRFDKSKCAVGIEAMHSYHYKYDEEQKCFSSEPEHDWSSHAADAFMEGAAALQDYVMPPAPPKPFEQVAQPMHNAFHLEDLWQTCGPGQGQRRV
jgi:phage terminase large subunit